MHQHQQSHQHMHQHKQPAPATISTSNTSSTNEAAYSSNRTKTGKHTAQTRFQKNNKNLAHGQKNIKITLIIDCLSLVFFTFPRGHGSAHRLYKRRIDLTRGLVPSSKLSISVGNHWDPLLALGIHTSGRTMAMRPSTVMRAVSSCPWFDLGRRLGVRFSCVVRLVCWFICWFEWFVCLFVGWFVCLLSVVI